MKKILKDFIVKNLGFKVSAIFCASIIWLIVINVQNPITSSAPFQSPLEIRNLNILEDSGIVLLNHNVLSSSLTEVEIFSRENLNITQNQVLAYIDILDLIEDIENFEEQTFLTLPVSYEINTTFPDSMFSVRVSRNVVLNLDKLESIYMPVQINMTGDLEYGLALEEVSRTPNYIKITGAKSQIKDIQNVVINLNKEDISEDHAQAHAFLVLDEDGNNIINRFTVSPSTVFLSTELTRSVVVPILPPVFHGNVSGGFTRGTFNFSPTSVSIYGKPLYVTEITGISLGNIDVTGINESTTYSIDLRNLVPPEINISGDYIVNVTVNVSPIVSNVTNVANVPPALVPEEPEDEIFYEDDETDEYYYEDEDYETDEYYYEDEDDEIYYDLPIIENPEDAYYENEDYEREEE